MTDIASDLVCGSPAITDNLNYADGTTLTEQPLSNGDVWQTAGYNPVVVGRKITNPNGNSYPGFPNVTAPGGTPQPVTAFGIAVRFLSAGLNGTLIAENWAVGPLTTMIHYNFSPLGWGLMVMLAGTWQTATWSGIYNCPQNEWRHVWMEISGTTVTLHHPDGSSTVVTSTLFGTVAPTGVRFQLKAATGASNTIEFGIPWCGGNRVAQIRALSDGASIQQVNRLEGFVSGNIPPTAKTLSDNIWTDIATITVVNGTGAAVFEIDATVDLGTYAVGEAYANGKWLIPVTGRNGGSTFLVKNPRYDDDSWTSNKAVDPWVALNFQVTNVSAGLYHLQAKATQVNGTPGTHPIVWECHKRGEQSAAIVAL